MLKNENEYPSQNAYKLLYRILAFVKPYIWLLFLVLILNLVFSTLSTISLAVIQPLMEMIFQTGDGMSKAVDIIADEAAGGFFLGIKDFLFGGIKSIVYNNDIYQMLLNFSIFLIILFIFKNIFKYMASVTQVKLEEGIIKSIRDKVFSHISYLSVDFFATRKEGTLISAITNDVSVLNSSTIAAFNTTIREFIQIVQFLILLLAISPYLTFIAFSTSIVSLVLLRVALKYIKRYASRMQNAMADYTSAMQETISGIRVVKAYNTENIAIKRFSKQTNRYILSAIKHKKVVALIPSINEVFAIIALCVVLFVGGTQVLITKEQSAADLMAFLFFLFAIMKPVTTMFDNITKFQRGFVAAERIFAILDNQPSVKSGKSSIKTLKDKLSINNVNFAYSDIAVIKTASFNIERGKKIAFVGASGSGKSTMLDLIIRFYDPVEGDINIDGTNIKNFKLESYRSMFGIVGQDTMLFNDSIANNIRYGYEQATDEDIIRSAKISNAYNFVMNLTDGFDTIVGDRGIMLSGGERQRIAIARALVRNPQILVFDEATSALDVESEREVQEAINNSLSDKTAIIVAHRLSTIINCDEILVFSNGVIVERGSHNKLLELNGVYKRLYDIQFATDELRTQ